MIAALSSSLSFLPPLFDYVEHRIANWIWRSSSVLYTSNGGAIILKVGDWDEFASHA